jgi:hypothetical protein
MKTVLEELFHGNLRLDERVVPSDPEYRALNRQIEDILKTWEEKLSEDDYAGLEDLLDLHNQSGSMKRSWGLPRAAKLALSSCWRY